MTTDHQKNFLLSTNNTLTVTQPHKGKLMHQTKATPQLSICYDNPEDEKKVTIGQIVRGNTDTDSSIDIFIPRLNEGVTHHIGELTVYGTGNSITFHPDRSSSVKELTLGEHSDYYRVYGEGNRVDLRHNSALIFVELDSRCESLELAKGSLISHARLVSDHDHPYRLFSRCSISGRYDRSDLLAIEYAQRTRGRTISMGIVSHPYRTIDSITLKETDLQLDICNLTGGIILVQQFNHGDECWVQIGCWLGTLEEARELIQGPADQWPSFKHTRELAATHNLPFDSMVDEARERYRAALNLIEANHASTATRYTRRYNWKD